MAYLYLAELEDSILPWRPGSGRSPTVKMIDTPKPCFCREWNEVTCNSLPSGMMWRPCMEAFFPALSNSSTEGSLARISALRELEQAWEEAEADLYLNSSASFASASPDGSSWKTFQLSLAGDLTDYSWNSMRWGLMHGGLLFQPLKWEPSIFENDGTYLPTPTACDYEKNVGRKSDGITPSGRDRWSLTVRARRGELPGHPKGALNPEWVEQAMAYPIGWSAIADWATPFIQWARKKRSSASCGEASRDA